jgi:hypothetical protein
MTKSYCVNIVRDIWDSQQLETPMLRNLWRPCEPFSISISTAGFDLALLWSEDGARSIKLKRCTINDPSLLKKETP